MVGEISAAIRTEVLRAIRIRYRDASRKDKSRMLDEFVAMVSTRLCTSDVVVEVGYIAVQAAYARESRRRW